MSRDVLSYGSAHPHLMTGIERRLSSLRLLFSQSEVVSQSALLNYDLHGESYLVPYLSRASIPIYTCSLRVSTLFTMLVIPEMKNLALSYILKFQTSTLNCKSDLWFWLLFKEKLSLRNSRQVFHFVWYITI